MIPKEELVTGGVYRIKSRNLAVGVFDGDRGFIGIREKFGDPFLFTEYYADGGPFGTVYPIELLPFELPEDYAIAEYYPSGCWLCGQLTGWHRECNDECTHEEPDKTHWFHLHPIPEGFPPHRPQSVTRKYGPLFAFLEKIEAEVLK